MQAGGKIGENFLLAKLFSYMVKSKVYGQYLWLHIIVINHFMTNFTANQPQLEVSSQLHIKINALLYARIEAALPQQVALNFSSQFLLTWWESLLTGGMNVVFCFIKVMQCTPHAHKHRNYMYHRSGNFH